jgi:hypothetical protein
MAIHFLQQIDPPVLPCLHEYVDYLFILRYKIKNTINLGLWN